MNRLEERLAWLERHVLEQDKAMLELSEVANKLRRELSSLRIRVVSLGGDVSPPDGSPSEDRPPHY